MNQTFINRNNYIPCNHNYHDNLSGHKIECDDLKNYKSVFDYFKLYFTPEIISIIAKESNLYFSHKLKENMEIITKIIIFKTYWPL